jgi:hypothetical protein
VEPRPHGLHTHTHTHARTHITTRSKTHARLGTVDSHLPQSCRTVEWHLHSCSAKFSQSCTRATDNSPLQHLPGQARAVCVLRSNRTRPQERAPNAPTPVGRTHVQILHERTHEQPAWRELQSQCGGGMRRHFQVQASPFPSGVARVHERHSHDLLRSLREQHAERRATVHANTDAHMLRRVQARI